MFSGICDRMTKEIVAVIPPTFKVHVIAPPDRRHSAWAGASIFAGALPLERWISMEEYNEHGPTIVHKKC